MGAGADGFVSPGMMVDHQIAKRSMRGLLIHLPNGSTVSQPAIAQGFHVRGFGGVLEQHRVMVVAVLAGLFSSSRIQFLRQRDGEQLKMVRTTRQQSGRFGALLHEIVQCQHARSLLAGRREGRHVYGQTWLKVHSQASRVVEDGLPAGAVTVHNFSEVTGAAVFVSKIGGGITH